MRAEALIMVMMMVDFCHYCQIQAGDLDKHRVKALQLVHYRLSAAADSFNTVQL